MVDVVCVGILVADVIVRPADTLPARGTLGIVDAIELHGGGCALNVSSRLVQEGLDAAVVGKVGADAFGDFLLGLLAQRGVDGTAVVRDPEVATSASVVLVDSSGERTFVHVPGANAALHADEIGDAAFDGRALHVGGSLVLDALDGEPTARLLAQAQRRGILTSLDPVFDPRGRWQLVVPALPQCDLVTPSLAEAQAITGAQDAADAARRLHELGAHIVAVTLGADGCHLVADGIDERVPAPKVHAVDGTGAGDAFAAAFLAALLAGERPLECARRANDAGAQAVTTLGAFPLR